MKFRVRAEISVYNEKTDQERSVEYDEWGWLLGEFNTIHDAEDFAAGLNVEFNDREMEKISRARDAKPEGEVG